MQEENWWDKLNRIEDEIRDLREEAEKNESEIQEGEFYINTVKNNLFARVTNVSDGFVFYERINITSEDVVEVVEYKCKFLNFYKKVKYKINKVMLEC